MFTATVEVVDGARPQPLIVIVLVTAAPASGMLTSVPLVPVQLPPVPPVTVSEYEAVWVAAPVPVMVIGYVPDGVDAVVAICSVDDEPDVTEEGVNVAVAPLGSPDAVSATVCAEPAVVAVDTVVVAAEPAATLPDDGETEIEKSFVPPPVQVGSPDCAATLTAFHAAFTASNSVQLPG